VSLCGIQNKIKKKKKLQTGHKLEEEDDDRRVEMCETLLKRYETIQPLFVS